MMRVLVILSLLLIPHGTADAKGKPRPGEGNYNLAVAGFANGSGNATVNGTKVSVDADVTAGDSKGKLTAKNLQVSKGHFTGTGTFLGQSATFKGRLDTPNDDDEKAIRGVRMVCTVATADGRYLKLMGFIPEQAAASTKRDDDDRGRTSSSTRK